MKENKSPREMLLKSFHHSDEIISLVAKIDSSLEKSTLTVAVDGGSASGKTTLARLLSEAFDCNVFHMDDFFLRPEQRTAERYSQPGGNVDRERFLSQVLLPLKSGREFSYNIFDCSRMALSESVSVTPKKLNIIEGAYSLHPELKKHYDISVFLDISPDLQKKRIINRNTPEKAERFFNEWIPLENTYFSFFNVKKNCDFTFIATDNES